MVLTTLIGILAIAVVIGFGVYHLSTRVRFVEDKTNGNDSLLKGKQDNE